MAAFNNMVITDKGKLLYAKAQGGTPIVFTRMQIGSGQIGSQSPTSLLALITPTNYVSISSIVTDTINKQAIISGIINNSGITVTTYACEIGLWATDPDAGEILYSYASAGTKGDYIAPASQGAYSWAYQINASIGDATNVTATISNLEYDYNIISSNVSFITITNGTQKDINKSIDTVLTTQAKKIVDINSALVMQGDEIDSINITVTAQGKEIDAVVDYIVEEGQEIGGSLNGFRRTKNGFVSQWGRASVPPGPGAVIPLIKPVAIISGIVPTCISGMYFVEAPGSFYTHAAPIASFNVATSSSKEEQIFWYAEGRM